LASLAEALLVLLGKSIGESANPRLNAGWTIAPAIKSREKNLASMTLSRGARFQIRFVV
jgi:hypothetical protein